MFIYSRVFSAIIIGLVAGCSTSSKPTTSAKAKEDPFLKEYAGTSLAGLLDGDLRGKFTELVFEEAQEDGNPVTEKEQIVYELTGSVEIWESTGPVSYTVTGRCVNRVLEVTLQSGNTVIPGAGTLVVSLFDVSCSVVLSYHGEDCTVSLVITDDATIADARTDYLESQRDK